MSMNVSSLTHLPLEILLEIAAYLSPEDLVRCAGVSQLMYTTFIQAMSVRDGRRQIDMMRYWRSNSVELRASRMSCFAVLFIQSMGCHPATHIRIHRLDYRNFRHLERYAMTHQLDAVEQLSVVDPLCLPMETLVNLFFHSRRLRHFTIAIHDEDLSGFSIDGQEPHVVFFWYRSVITTFLTHITISLGPDCRDCANVFEVVAEELVLASPFLVHLDINFARVLHRRLFSQLLVPPIRSLRTCLFTTLGARRYLIHNQEHRDEERNGTVLGYSLPRSASLIGSWEILLQHYACTLTRLYLEGVSVRYGLMECEFPYLEELILRIMPIVEEDDGSSTDDEEDSSSDDESMGDHGVMDLSEDGEEDSQVTPDRMLASFLAHSAQLHTLIVRSEKIGPASSSKDICITDHVLETLSSRCRKLDYLCISGGSIGHYSSDGLYRFARDSARRLHVLELDCTGTLNRGQTRQHLDLGNLILMARNLRYFELRHVCTIRRRCQLFGQCPRIFSHRFECRFFERTRYNDYSECPFTPRIPVEHLFVSSASAIDIAQ
ncbi:hypothetical protein BX666DRAFT_2125013 [Dichotomocladium elegans]|nr:hypothetical protein BX666DRAFT_2125013 [Dichotomocladium elegans]